MNRKEILKREITSEFYSLTASDRRLLKVFFGYVGVKGKREKKKKKEDAGFFVRQCLWPNSDVSGKSRSRNGEEVEQVEHDNSERLDNEDEPFDMGILKDNEYFNFPSLLQMRRESIERLILDEGIHLDEREEAGIIRCWQVRGETDL